MPVEQTSEEIEETTTEETTEHTETEVEAMKHGWNPEGVEGKKNLDAEEFMDRQKYFDEIRHLKKQMREQRSAFNTLTDHHKKVQEIAKKEAIEELKKQKKLALEERDYDAVVEIDEKLSTEKATESVPEVAPQAEEFTSWVEQNSWYKTDNALKVAADTFGAGYFAEHPGASLDEVYEKVTEKIMELYPDKFSNANKSRASKVEGRRSQSPSKSKLTAKDLTDEERQVMRTLVRSGSLTEEQYLKEYAAIKSAE